MVADQSVEARRGPSTVQQGLWVHGKQERQRLTVREAVKARQVDSSKRANVTLKQEVKMD